MLIARSIGLKLFATTTAAAAFFFLYETTVMDSRFVGWPGVDKQLSAPPAPGSKLQFAATGYCKGTTTASGVNVRTGIAAADPEILPVGSVILVDHLPDRYNGVYTIMDTGPSVQGRHIDIYMWNCNEALALGRRDALISIVRLGWNPQASTPSLIDRLLRRPAAPPPPLPSRRIEIQPHDPS